MAAHADEAVHLNGMLVDGRVFMPLRAAGDQFGALTTEIPDCFFSYIEQLKRQ